MLKDRWTINFINECEVSQSIEVYTMSDLMKKICIIHSKELKISGVIFYSGQYHQYTVLAQTPAGTIDIITIWEKTKEDAEQAALKIGNYIDAKARRKY